jgi:hypothetical protein
MDVADIPLVVGFFVHAEFEHLGFVRETRRESSARRWSPG